MELFRNLFICASILTVSAILTHGLAVGLPYWIYRLTSVHRHNRTIDVLAYEGLYKACIEYDDAVVKHVKRCISTPDRNWLLDAPHKDWIVPERYLALFAMSFIALSFVNDVLVATRVIRSKHLASACNILTVCLILSVLSIYGAKSDSTAYYVAFYCEIITLILTFLNQETHNFCRESFEEPYCKFKDTLDDLAKNGQWYEFIQILRDDSSEINTTRLPALGDSPPSLMTPLHHAANGGASKEAFENLLKMGAALSLRTADNETAFHIAKRKGLDREIQELLKLPEDIFDNKNDIGLMEGALHDVIYTRIEELIPNANISLPQLSYMFEKGEFYFPVPGINGGFTVKPYENGIEVYSEVDGSEMTHFIDRKGNVTTD